MANVVKCDVCTAVNKPDEAMHIQFFTQANGVDLRKWKHEVKGTELDHGIDVCPECFNKIMEVLNVNKRVKASSK